MNDAFISYRREGGYLMAQLLRSALKDKGVYCYLDLEEDRSGQFDERLLDAIRDSSNFILILTKGTLDRCVNKDDWVRREIVEAVASDKNIIPVMYPDFVWPKELNECFPKEVLILEKKQGVILRQEYLQATIEKIIDYMIDVTKQNYKGILSDEIPDGTNAFFTYGFSRLKNIQCVDMAFHAGADWRRSSEKVDILTSIIDKGITLRVLVNSAETVTSVCSHMSQPLKKYVGFDNCVEEWLELARIYPDIIHVRVADVPLLHRLYILKEEKIGFVNVKYYTYGNYTPDKDFRRVFDNSGMEYKLYTGEFDYIWDKASHEVK